MDTRWLGFRCKLSYEILQTANKTTLEEFLREYCDRKIQYKKGQLQKLLETKVFYHTSPDEFEILEPRNSRTNGGDRLAAGYWSADCDYSSTYLIKRCNHLGYNERCNYTHYKYSEGYCPIANFDKTKEIEMLMMLSDRGGYIYSIRNPSKLALINIHNAKDRSEFTSHVPIEFDEKTPVISGLNDLILKERQEIYCAPKQRPNELAELTEKDRITKRELLQIRLNLIQRLEQPLAIL